MAQCTTQPPPARAPVTQLSTDQINRYKRHLILPEVGVEGQKKLLNAKVLCIGAGGLGCPIGLYLAAAGVGTIGFADIDVVSPSNLQRQVLFGVSDIGADKVAAAARRLKDLNPDCNVVQHKVIVNSQNVMECRQFTLRRDPDCPVCGDAPTITAPIDYEQFCGVPILDPKSLAETAEEVRHAKEPATAKPQAADLDARGLPPGYAFKAEWE